MKTQSSLSFLLVATAVWLGLATTATAQATNTNTTVQEGRVCINRTFQSGDSNDNATYQSCKVSINQTRQRGGDNRNRTAQFGRVNHNKTRQSQGDRPADRDQMLSSRGKANPERSGRDRDHGWQARHSANRYKRDGVERWRDYGRFARRRAD